MNLKKNIYVLVFALALVMSSCSSDPESPGREYMPDMGHSIAYEANVYTDYYLNTWEDASVKQGSGKTLLELSSPRKPINGTIPRGYAGGSKKTDRGIVGTQNGSVPYYYADTEPERTRATNEILDNPFPISEAAIADGKNLYNIFCATCHGEKGDGNGYLVRDNGGVYPAQPANLINEEFTAASNGRFYHALIYGKNVMGGYADKVSYEERWNVIHYIRSLQAKETKTVYSEKANTLNDFAVPAATIQAPIAENNSHDDASHSDEAHEGDHSHDDGHGHEGDHGHEDGNH